MLNAIKFLVGSSQHVFPEIFYKTILLLRKAKFLDLFLKKNHLRYQKGNKKLHITHYYGYFYFSHFS